MDYFDVARFWSRVEVRKREQCWPWRYGPNDQGYGDYRFDGGEDRDAAHRVAYRISKGTIPKDMLVRHSCDNPLCCNPAHLELGTHQDNVADRVKRDRSAIGEQNGRAKLNVDAVRHIRESHLSKRVLAGMYDVDERTVDKIKKGEIWTHC